MTSRIDLDVVENSLLPTRHFYKQFDDSLRVYINETSTPQERVRDAIELEIEGALRGQGINILDKTMNIPLAREFIQKKVQAERYQTEFMSRSMQFMSDEKMRNNYQHKVNEVLSNYEQNPDQFYEVVNGNIQNIFEQAYLKRLNTIVEKSAEAQQLEKRRMFIRLKKFLIKNRLLKFYN